MLGGMYIVVLNYIAPLEEIDHALAKHGEWLERNYQGGRFLLSGRRNPRVGGVIITKSMPREELDAVLAEDPFSALKLAQHEVFEFFPTKTAPELNILRETGESR